MQATPTLYGKDAEAVLREIEKEPTKEQIRKAGKRAAYFAQVRKKNL